MPVLLLLFWAGDDSSSTCGVPCDSLSHVTTISCRPVQARLALVRSGQAGTGQRARPVQAPPEGSKAAAAPAGIGGPGRGAALGAGAGPAAVAAHTTADPPPPARPPPPP